MAEIVRVRKVCLLVLVAALSACTQIFAEQREITSGEFHSFRIGMDKVQSLDAVRSENDRATIVGEMSVEDSEGRKNLIASAGMPDNQSGALLSCDQWSFSSNDGAMFYLSFSNGHLIRLRYAKPKMALP